MNGVGRTRSRWHLLGATTIPGRFAYAAYLAFGCWCLGCVGSERTAHVEVVVDSAALVEVARAAAASAAGLDASSAGLLCYDRMMVGPSRAGVAIELGEVQFTDSTAVLSAVRVVMTASGQLISLSPWRESGSTLLPGRESGVNLNVGLPDSSKAAALGLEAVRIRRKSSSVDWRIACMASARNWHVLVIEPELPPGTTMTDAIHWVIVTAGGGVIELH